MILELEDVEVDPLALGDHALMMAKDPRGVIRAIQQLQIEGAVGVGVGVGVGE